MKLPQPAQDMIATFPLGFVATVGAGGRPSVSPKGTFLVLDEETIAFGEIRSPQTLSNLGHLPECEVNFIDVFKRKAWRVRGAVVIVREGTDEFSQLLHKWQTIWGDLSDRINAVVKINVEHANEVTTPPYDDGATEEEMIAIYKAKFTEIYP